MVPNILFALYLFELKLLLKQGFLFKRSLEPFSFLILLKSIKPRIQSLKRLLLIFKFLLKDLVLVLNAFKVKTLIELTLNLLNRCIDIGSLLVSVADLLVHEANLPANLSIVLLNLTLDFEVLVSLGILDLQLVILLYLTFNLGKLFSVFYDLFIDPLYLFNSLLLASSHLMKHISLLLDHMLSRVYEALPVPLISLKINKLISLQLRLPHLLFFKVREFSLIQV